MARRVPLQPLALCFALLLAGVPAAEAGSRAPNTLVSYSFDDELATGPDTVAVFQKSDGWVRLASSFKWSGYRAVEIRDVAGDGDFPELQGYFALRREGRLHVHFALLTTDALETFNLALAGPRGFAVQKDGIAFWMLSRNGFLHHYSDSMPKRLFALRPFVWYFVDLTYDVEAGMYDLVVHEEGGKEPVVELRAQANASHQPGSAVDKFSFIGDTGDDMSNVVYYVDDVVVSADKPVPQSAFVAPGRRKLFVDAWHERQKLTRSKLSCLPVVELADLGVTAEVAATLDGDVLASLAALIGSREVPNLDASSASAESKRLLQGAMLHRRGCAALEQGKAAEALELFETAAGLVPEAATYELSAALSLARLERFAEADARLASVEPALRNDPRLALAAAMIGLARKDLDEAERWLQAPAEGSGGRVLDGMLAEQYFFVLLWKGSFRKAERYASGMAERLAASEGLVALWLERAGDAAFLSGEIETARNWYMQSFGRAPASALLLTKLSDVYFLLGDLDLERQFRQAVYGSLQEGD